MLSFFRLARKLDGSTATVGWLFALALTVVVLDFVTWIAALFLVARLIDQLPVTYNDIVDLPVPIMVSICFALYGLRLVGGHVFESLLSRYTFGLQTMISVNLLTRSGEFSNTVREFGHSNMGYAITTEAWHLNQYVKALFTFFASLGLSLMLFLYAAYQDLLLMTLFAVVCLVFGFGMKYFSGRARAKSSELISLRRDFFRICEDLVYSNHYLVASKADDFVATQVENELAKIEGVSRTLSLDQRHFRTLSEMALVVLITVGSVVLSENMIEVSLVSLGILIRLIPTLVSAGSSVNRLKILGVSVDHLSHLHEIVDQHPRLVSSGLSIAKQDMVEIQIHKYCVSYLPNHSQITSFGFKAGNFVAITGVSGSGKSSLLRLLAGCDYFGEFRIEIKTNGNLFYAGPSRGLGSYFEVVFVPQEPSIFRSSVVDNITFGMDMPRREIAWLLEIVKLDDMAKKVLEGDVIDLSPGVRTLSGGEKQRIMLARALGVRPQILLLDEPSSALNDDLTVEIFKNIRTTFSELTVIAATHDRRLIKEASSVFSVGI